MTTEATVDLGDARHCADHPEGAQGVVYGMDVAAAPSSVHSIPRSCCVGQGPEGVWRERAAR